MICKFPAKQQEIDVPPADVDGFFALIESIENLQREAAALLLGAGFAIENEAFKFIELEEPRT